MSETIARFIPNPDIRLVHETIIYAPAALVFDVAEHFELDSIRMVRAIFWVRAKILGAPYQREPMQDGLVAAMQRLGWGILSYVPGHDLIMGSVTQPWVGDVKFQAVTSENFAPFSDPGLVKIAWTLEAEPLGDEQTLFRTETRVLATDENARRKFRTYWRKFGVGISMIRWLMMRALKKEAESRYRAEKTRLPPAYRP